MKKSKQTYSFLNGIKDGLPIGLGYLSVSFALGVQASLLGIPFFMSVFMSMTNLTSAGQLAGITIIAAIGTFLEIFLTQLVINARYFLMSFSMSQKIDPSTKISTRLFYSFFLTDEIFAVASSKPGPINKKYYLGLVVLPYFSWAIGTLLGAVLGEVMPSRLADALSIALYAMLICIIVPPSIKIKGVLPAVLIAAGISCFIYYAPFMSFISQGIAIIIAALIAATIVAILFPIKPQKEEDN